jgi:hypothetical protein
MHLVMSRFSGFALALLIVALSLGSPFNAAPTQASPAQPGIIFVDEDARGANDGSSWADAYNELWEALDRAVSGDEIWVAEGAYRPGAGRGDSFTLKENVAVYGGFAGIETALGQRDWHAHPALLSGDIGVPGDSRDNSYHVVVARSVGATAILDGFVITGGNADQLGTEFHLGGGLYGKDASPTLRNCAFRNNQAGHGGGVFFDGGSAALIDVQLEGNTAVQSGGGMYTMGEDATPTLINVAFVGNTARWSGGGLYNYFGGAPRLVNSSFVDNQALQNPGGGVYNEGTSSPTLTNVTMYGNRAVSGGAMCGESQTEPHIANSILWENEPAGVCDVGNVIITYSIVEGGFVGAGNGSANPQFLDAGAGDVRVRNSSPAVDAGDNVAVPVDTFDLDRDGNVAEPTPMDMSGNPRFADIGARPDTGNGATPMVDMGAYEVEATIGPAVPPNRLYFPLVFK